MLARSNDPAQPGNEFQLTTGLGFKMANVIEADTALWLRNKLDNEDQWSSGGITSLLTADVLRNTYRSFRSLDHRVRLKLLLSFLEIRRRNLENLKDELGMVIGLGLDDEDDWVRLVACILSEYPESASFHPDVREGSETFAQLVHELSGQGESTAYGVSISNIVFIVLLSTQICFVLRNGWNY